MGLMDKVKSFLFDEDEIEVTVSDDELPEREPKKKDNYKSVIKYHDGDIEEEKEERDPIKEIKLTDDSDFDDNITNKFRFEDFDTIPTKTVVEEVEEPKLRDSYQRENNYRTNMYNIEQPKRHQEEVKDYKKIIEEKKEVSTKKPFKVTPVISPVYGIVDKNYKPSEIVNRSEVRKEEPKIREFGPVSYNDSPLPTKKIAQEIVELNNTISDLMEEEMPIKKTVESTVVIEESIIIPEPKKEEVKEEKTSGIEEKYINNIEDSFEPTSEYESIKQSDLEMNKKPIEEEIETEELYLPNELSEEIDTNIIDDEIPPYENSEIFDEEDEFEKTAPIKLSELGRKPEVKDEDEHLDETIETDLFNLIDSMYKSDEELSGDGDEE